MSIMLPGIVADALDILGFTWPNLDEDKIREDARAWKTFAADVEYVIADTDRAARMVAEENHGESINAFSGHWAGVGGQGDLREAADAANLVGDALELFADIVVGLKTAVIAEASATAAVIVGTAGAALLVRGPLTGVLRKLKKEAIEEILSRIVPKLSQEAKERFARILRNPIPNVRRGPTRSSHGAPSPRPGGCFVAGTTVLTVDGGRPIESLLVGDEVIARDPHGGRRAIRSVVARVRHTVPVVLCLTVQELQINCSPEHPFWTDPSGWKKAADLRAGDVLVDVHGAQYPIDAITRREGTFAVFNIEVDDLRTYHVSELHLLVHNKAWRVPRPEGTPKKVSDNYLKDKGVDPHTAKEDLPGPASRFDIYVDKNGNMFGVRKGAKPEKGQYLGNLDDP